MGLEEKRLVKQLKEEVVPKYEKELQEIAGNQISYDLDWDSFADDMDALNYVESRILTEVSNAFRDLCKDDLGKDAVKESVKKVNVKNLSSYGCDDITLNGGTLNLHCDWGYGALWDADSISQRVASML